MYIINYIIHNVIICDRKSLLLPHTIPKPCVALRKYICSWLAKRPLYISIM